MLKSRNWRIFVIYLICRTDFGMIGCENHSNAKTELAFDRKYRGHVHLAELVFQSKQTTYCFDFCWLYFNFKIYWWPKNVLLSFCYSSKVDIFSMNICSILRLTTNRLNSQKWIKQIYWKYALTTHKKLFDKKLLFSHFIW